jgi:hypothetical protein
MAAKNIITRLRDEGVLYWCFDFRAQGNSNSPGYAGTGGKSERIFVDSSGTVSEFAENRRHLLYAQPTSNPPQPTESGIEFTNRESGTHSGANNLAYLSDSSATWAINGFVGLTVYNDTDHSSGTITANSYNTVTATLSGGTQNDWDTGDAYTIGGSTQYLQTSTLFADTEIPTDNFSLIVLVDDMQFENDDTTNGTPGIDKIAVLVDRSEEELY